MASRAAFSYCGARLRGLIWMLGAGELTSPRRRQRLLAILAPLNNPGAALPFYPMYQHSVVPSLRLAYSGRPYILWRVQGAHGKSPVVSQCAHSIRILHHYAALCKVSTARYHHTPRIGTDFKLGVPARQPTTAHRFVETRNRLSPRQDAMCAASALLHEAYTTEQTTEWYINAEGTGLSRCHLTCTHPVITST